jgi:saccharopepsin
MPSYAIAVLSIAALLRCGSSLEFPSEPVQDDVSLLQKFTVEDEHSPGDPILINLHRDSVPVKRQGVVVSFRTTYWGVIDVGSPVPQQFRVVFDTGSGQVVVPASTCESDACLVHKRFNMSASQTSVPINADGFPVPDGELCDEVDISFGTGQVTGQFARDRVCVGSPPLAGGEMQTAAQNKQLCLEMNVVMAVKMSSQPFQSFNFDGIMGLGLKNLAISDEFSFFDRVAESGRARSSHFGVFLTEGEVEGEESEIAIGGYNAQRVLHPLAWSKVAMADYGYWQVKIKALRIDGKEIDVCKDGTCRGIVDTGTSHLGIPGVAHKEVAAMLTVDAGDTLDCRLAKSPLLELELDTINITLNAENYMRRLPLREGVKVGSATGVIIPENESQVEGTVTSEPTPWMDRNATEVTRHCSPRIMPVNLPEPIGPKLFLLGEPVLHRYYTVFDWKGLQVGFSLANNHRNTAEPGSLAADTRGALPDEVETLLMQQSIVRSTRNRDDDGDDVLFVQVNVQLNIRS